MNDGSSIHDLQIIVEINPKFEDILKQINTGVSVSVLGKLTKSSGAGQNVELIAKKINKTTPINLWT